MNAPGPWAFVLLTLAAYRLWRILARDTITEPIREAMTGYDDDEAPSLHDVPAVPPANPSNHETRANRNKGGDERFYVYLSTLIRCPWCSGFYVSVATYVVWAWVGDVALAVCTPLAISAAVGLLKKNLDR